MTITVAELTIRTGVDVLDHLERETAIAVLDGVQAQGDLLVVPFGLLTDTRFPDTGWSDVPAKGVEVIRGAAGANPHVLVADPGTCRWSTRILDPQGLGLGCLETSGPAYLLHPEHGGSGIAPGRYLIRRQREVMSAGFGRSSFGLVQD